MKEIIKFVTFDVTPIVCVRVIQAEDTKEVKREKKKYLWNGADIPSYLMRIIGSKTDNAFLTASMVHDYMLENKKYIHDIVLNKCISIKEYRRLTSLVFREILKTSGVNVFKANVMAWFVDIYQMCHKGAWKCQ